MSNTLDQSGWTLVLGGGAAKGLAHIGVRKALQEEGYRPTAIVGTSMGALIGAAIAYGLSVDDMYSLLDDWVPKRYFSLDFFAKNGIIGGKKIEELLNTIFQDIAFESLAIPLRAIATDIDTGKPRIFEEGSLVSGLRASISIPGIFEPFVCEGGSYVDGGIIKNLPIDFAPTKNVLASSVFLDAPKEPISLIHSRREQIKKGKMRGINQSVVTKSLNLMIRQNESISIADPHHETIVFSPPSCGFFDFDCYKDVIDNAYLYTKAKLSVHSTKKKLTLRSA